jgi:hypothetical protein
VNKFSFGISSVEEWAQFSSDYNPIHFNLEYATASGLDGLIVHGMLALLPVKQAVSCEYVQQNGEAVGWMKFRALFRNPIPHDELIILVTKPSDAGLSFRLCAAESKHEHFRGTYNHIEVPTAQIANNGDALQFRTRLAADHARRFTEFYPKYQERWIALDATIFSEFIKTKLTIIEDMVNVHMVNMHNANAGKRLLLQVSHTVIFDSRYFDARTSGHFDCNKITYGLSMPEIITSNDRLIGTVTLSVIACQQIVMVIEIGLIAKFLSSIM